MIDFYQHKKDCLECYEAREILKKLVVSHKLFFIEEKSGYFEPIIIEGNKRIKGHSSIKSYLIDLEATMALWNQFQGDSCYIDKDNKTC